MNLTLRLTEEIYKKLKKIALQEERSINGEINYIIKKYIENSAIYKNDNKKND